MRSSSSVRRGLTWVIRFAAERGTAPVLRPSAFPSVTHPVNPSAHKGMGDKGDEWGTVPHCIPGSTDVRVEPMDRPKLRLEVIARDLGCMGRKAELTLDHPIQTWHVCRGRLTLEHVTMVHSHLEGKVDNKEHCVALCFELNGNSFRLAPHWMKEWFRIQLRAQYPECNNPSKVEMM